MTAHIRVADAARADYAAAHNCAESVIRSLRDGADLAFLHEASGSGFTSGIGNSGCVCGALAGAVMAMGAYAESEALPPEAQRLRAETLSAQLIERFKERWGATCCRVIKRGMDPGSRESATHCADITESTAALVLEIIGEARQAPAATRMGSRDATAMAQRLAASMLAGSSVGFAVALGVALLGRVTAWPVVAGSVLGLAVAAFAEAGPPRARLGRRILGALGLVAGTLGVFLALLGGESAVGVFAAMRGSWIVLAPVGLGLLVLALVRAYEVFRYR